MIVFTTGVPERRIVFTVQLRYEDCSDTSSLGVFDSFEKAAAASIAHLYEDYEVDGHFFHDVIDPYIDEFVPSEIWLEGLFGEQESGTYLVITREEVK